jgi:hypothetical protein
MFHRLNTASPKITMASIRAPETQPQAGHSESEITVASPAVEDGIPEGGRWTAASRTPQGTSITATIERRGDELELVVTFDSSESSASRRCRTYAAAATFECWLRDPSRVGKYPSYLAEGKFPEINLEPRGGVTNNISTDFGGALIVFNHAV